ncbi:MAG: MBL fold metallo-hydrolase [Chloroflexi bacterium]|nr:MBL fold metallo-hydrolase [Chloroflexota bacterium]
MKLKRIVVGAYASNCYIVRAESGDCIIIDPGAEAEQIIETIREVRLTARAIVLTHGHIDHTGAVSEVKQATGAALALHADDAGQLRRLSPQPPGTPLTPDILLKEGDDVQAGDVTFRVLHTPGHTAGGICLLGQGIIFTGDTLFRYGIGRYDLPGGDYDRLMASLHRLMALPDDTAVYPGHGPETTIGDERRGNPFLRG